MFGLFNKSKSFFPKLKGLDYIVLTSGLSLFLVITLSTISKFSIWFDEAFGSYLVRFDYFSVAKYTSNDVHPPLYYWLLKLWTTIFGNTEIGLRSMSVFFGIVTIVIVFLFVYRYFGRRAAYVSMFFLIVSPLFIRYSQEARMYTLLTAEVTAATYMLLYATENKKRWPWIVYGVIVGLGMLTQYFAILAWVAHWVWRYVTVRTPGEAFKKSVKKVFSKEWVMAYAVGIGVFLFWLPFMAYQFAVVQGFGFWIKPVSYATLVDFIGNFFLFKSASEITSWLAVGLYSISIILCVLIYRSLSNVKTETLQSIYLIFSLAVVPFVLLVLVSLPPLRSAFVDRYLLPATVFMSIAAAVIMTGNYVKLKKQLTIAIASLFVLLSCFGVYNQSIIGNYNRATDTANVTRNVLEAARAVDSNAPIIAETPWVFYEAIVYATDSSPVYFMDESTKYEYGSLTMLKEDDTNKITNLDNFTNSNNKFWVVSTTDSQTVRPKRDNWKPLKTITVDNYLKGGQAAVATLFSAE